MTLRTTIDPAATVRSRRALRILIVGVNYAPEHAGIGPYTTELAEHLSRVGHGVTVLTGMPHYPAWTLDTAYVRRLRAEEHRNGVRVLRRALYVPPRQSAMRRAMYEASFLASALPWTRMERPDAILGIVPSLSGAVLARWLAARYRTRYGLLFQDPMSQAAMQSGIPGGGRAAEATRMVERWAVSRAKAVAAVSPEFFPFLSRLGVPLGRLWHVPNWANVREPDRSDDARARTRARQGWRADETVVLHAGNIGLKQHLGQVLDAAALQNGGGHGRHVRFVLLGDGSQRAVLRARAQADRLPNVDFLDPEPQGSFMDVLAAADVLLVTERASVRDMALPSKLTSYASAGRPVIAAVNPVGATAAEVLAAGNGLVVDAEDPDALLGAIHRLVVECELSLHLAAAGPPYARVSLSADSALARAEELVLAIVRGRPSPVITAGSVG